MAPKMIFYTYDVGQNYTLCDVAFLVITGDQTNGNPSNYICDRDFSIHKSQASTQTLATDDEPLYSKISEMMRIEYGKHLREELPAIANVQPMLHVRFHAVQQSQFFQFLPRKMVEN
jgi:hypothetical protein